MSEDAVNRADKAKAAKSRKPAEAVVTPAVEPDAKPPVTKSGAVTKAEATAEPEAVQPAAIKAPVTKSTEVQPSTDKSVAAPKSATTTVPSPAGKPAKNVVPVPRAKEGITFTGGTLTVISRTLTDGLAITAFAGPYEIGQAKATPIDDFGQVVFKVRDLPELEFPFDVRFVDAASGAEALPPLPIRTSAEVLSALGERPQGTRIAGLYDDRVVFAFTARRQSALVRSLQLSVNGVAGPVAESVPEVLTGAAAKGPRVHQITFELTEALTDGAILELSDPLSGTIVFTRTLSWVNLVGAMTDGQKLLEARLDVIEKSLSVLTGQVKANSVLSRERMMLERLDLFYALLQDRLDREFRQLNPVTVVAQRPRPTRDVIFNATQVEGVGYFELEVDGPNRWRWFGPRSTLAFRDVIGPCRAVRMNFSAVPAACDPNAIRIRINGKDAAVKVQAQGTDVTLFAACDVSLFAASNMITLIVETEFPYSFSADGDDRVLAAVFSEAAICY